MSNKNLLFSVGLKDCEVQTFRVGGAGGQKRDKTSTGVRVTHRDSRASGECRETRSQHENKKRAFLKMIATDKFKLWHKIETSKRMGSYVSVESKVEKSMNPNNIVVEVRDNEGKWKLKKS